MPVVLYGYEIWFLALSEERRLKEIEKRVLRRVFGLKADETERGWRKPHKQEMYNLHSSPKI
jgi:hypothetical protein